MPLVATLVVSFTIAGVPDNAGRLGVGVAEAKGKGGKGGQSQGHGSQYRVEKSGKKDQYHETERGGSSKMATDREARGQSKRQAAAETQPRWGDTASQLKHRNAAKASESAFAHASERSNVGRISNYRDAARATLDKERNIETLDLEIANLRTEQALAAGDGDLEAADAIGAEIVRLEDERLLAEDQLYDLRAAEQVAYDNVGGPELNDHDYQIFRGLLGLE